MSAYKVTCTLIFFFLLFSCSENNSTESPNNFPINEEINVVVNGFFSSSTVIFDNRYPTFYPGQIFEKESFNKEGVFNEVKNEEIPYFLIFNFPPAPYVEEVTVPQGYLSFTKVLTNAMNSEEWKIYNNRTTETQFLSYGVYDSSDEAKHFLKDPSFYNLLDKGDKRYLFLAKIISSRFDITPNIDLKERNDILYVSSVSFGRYAYIAIPTNSPEKVIDIFTNGILKKNTNYIDRYINISTSINIMEKGGKDLHYSYLGRDGFYNLVNIFDFNNDYIGVPICFQVKDPITNESIRLSHN